MEKGQFHWEILAAMVLFIGTVLGVVIPLHIQTTDQISAMRRETTEQLSAIHQEMKDFHGRLCAIEERYRSKQ